MLYAVFTGDFSLKVFVRECTTVPLSTSDGCVPETQETEMLKGLMGLALGFVKGFGNVEVDGTVCVCSDNYCNPDPCDAGSINLFNTIW